MPRCLLRRTLPLALSAGCVTATLSLSFGLPLLPLLAPATAHAQASRPLPIPPYSLRGEMRFGLPPEVLLNKQATRLSPATRIRSQSNTLVMSGTLAGQTHTVNYTLDAQTGLVQDVWLLRPEELARRWPTTREEATTWSFDPVNQNWVKP